MLPRLVFVHGIGGLRNPGSELTQWVEALSGGMRQAGHSRIAGSLQATFVDYSDLFLPDGAQGKDEAPPADEIVFLTDLVGALLTNLAKDAVEESDLHEVEVARSQLGQNDPQGFGEPVRLLIAALTAVLQIPGIRQTAQWASARSLLLSLAQVARYLRRGEPENGHTIDQRIRARVRSALHADQPAIIVAHSLGSVVAFEALHDLEVRVPLLVTLGSPLAMATLVLDRVEPKPPMTPSSVERWLNFWDRDDVIVARPRLERHIRPNALGVRPVSSRVDSDGLWVHSAAKYLAQAAVAGPIAEALRE
ncbi:hypothetical protein [Amycolatopsis sp. lyj-90]|uniref:hypothetical protein n=1 Tax=Amycolatopsis sp. lyj-90 TaxID=2789285 RepID=UPI00397DE016